MNFEYLHNLHRGRTLFLTGSGPSLIENDLSLLAGKNTMCMNHTVFFARDFIPTYWVWRDYWCKPFQHYIRAAAYRGITVIVPAAPDVIDEPAPMQLIRINACDLPGHFMAVTIDMALGLAIHMGFRRVFLLGCDNGPYIGRDHLVTPNRDLIFHYAGFLPDVVERFRQHLEIMSCGVHHGLKQIRHFPLAEAIQMAASDGT